MTCLNLFKVWWSVNRLYCLWLKNWYGQHMDVDILRIRRIGHQLNGHDKFDPTATLPLHYAVICCHGNTLSCGDTLYIPVWPEILTWFEVFNIIWVDIYIDRWDLICQPLVAVWGKTTVELNHWIFGFPLAWDINISYMFLPFPASTLTFVRTCSPDIHLCFCFSQLPFTLFNTILP